MREPVQKSARGNDDGLTRNGPPISQQDAGSPMGHAILDHQLSDLGLQDPQVRFPLQDIAHANTILLLVALRARRPDGGPAAGVQQPELDADRIRHLAHHAAERVDLADQVALRDTAHGRIAGHLRDEIQVHGDHGGTQAHSGARPRSFATGMPGADNDHVILTWLYHAQILV
jgi:hypothetical protein